MSEYGYLIVLNEMTVRPAAEADFPAIKTLIAQYPDVLVQDHLPDPDEFFVAEETDPSTGSGQVVGCCALEVYSKRLAEVRSLAVSKERRGKGIGTALVEACLAAAEEKGVHEVLAITGAVRLFEKYGFGAYKGEKYALIKVLN